MPSASATDERRKFRCPACNRKTILIGGKVKCPEKLCGTEFTLGELFARELVRGEAHYDDFLRNIVKVLPRPHDTELHAKARAIMGESFFGYRELSAAGLYNPAQIINSADIVEAHLPTLWIPYSDEVLRAAAATHYFMVGFQRETRSETPSLSNFSGYAACWHGGPLCGLHNNDYSFFPFWDNGRIPFRSWLLVRMQPLDIPYQSYENIAQHLGKYLPENERLITAGELIYFFTLLTRLGKKLPQGESFWSGLSTVAAIVGEEWPILTKCSAETSPQRWHFTVQPSAYAEQLQLARHKVITVRKPDLPRAAWLS